MDSFLCGSAKSMTHPGRRVNNEDYADYYEPADPIEYLQSGCLYIVADGVGGASFGEKASQYAVRKVLHEYYQPSEMRPWERLERAILAANDDIYSYSHSGDNEMQMATTMVAALVVGSQLLVANVGDSPAYLIQDGGIEQLSRDHSLLGEMIRSGTLSEESGRSTRVRNQLTRSLGAQANVQVDISRPRALKPGDRIVLCSDGVTRYAGSQQILQLAGSGSAEDAASRLIDFAVSQGGADNITALVIVMGTPKKSADDISDMPTDISSLRSAEQTRLKKGGKGKTRQASLQASPADILWHEVKPVLSSRIFQITVAVIMLAALAIFAVYWFYG